MPATSEGILAGLFARGPVGSLVSDRGFAHAMLEFELALIQALARTGLATAAAVDELAPLCTDADWLDLAELGRVTADSGTPVPGLLAALRGRLDPGGPAAAHLHRGATSQDVVDTASMLLTRRAIEPLLADLAAAASACAELVEAHRGTVMPGRTLLQQGVPTTFGLKAAGWLSGLDAACAELAQVREHELALQFGGAVGTLAALGDRGLEVVADVASRLGLAVPAHAWHSIRVAPARIASALGLALGVMGKIGGDVALLAQTEVGEVREGPARQGGSSAMPHKRNPVNAIAIVACAQRGPGLVATVLSAMAQEHERAAGRWQAEWPVLAELLRLTGSAAAATHELLAGLEVDPARMRSNIVAAAMSESVVSALAPSLGARRSRELIQRSLSAAVEQSSPLRELLLQSPEIRDTLGADGVDRALDPCAYLGVAGELIDRALAAHRGRGSHGSERL